MAQDGNYIFPLAEGVTRRHVSYQNRYGITIAADLYLPPGHDEAVRQPAVLVGSPYGAVKEQAAGIYANELARRNFLALAFDPSYNGYSDGSPRHTPRRMFSSRTFTPVSTTWGRALSLIVTVSGSSECAPPGPSL